MSVYLISYDLIAPGQKYDNVHKAIKLYGTWAKPLESVWFVKTDQTPLQVRDYVLKSMDANDKLLVVEVQRNASAFQIPDEVWKWMDKNL